MSDVLLSVSGLRKVYPHYLQAREIDYFIALDSVSFNLRRGESLAIVGESGSGKTTAARIIAGLQSATAGTVVFDGAELVAPRTLNDRRIRARQIQMVFQDPFGSLDPSQTLADALDELLLLHYQEGRSWRVDRIQQLLQQVGLDERHGRSVPRNLSGGQRQRFAITKALVTQPKLLILDESVAALDVSVQAQVLNLLIDLRRSLGISYLFVSHDLAVVRQISDNCLVMQKGRVVEMGSTAAVLDAPTQEYTKELLASVPRPGWRPKRRNTEGAAP